jgi:hypothetical protein
MTHHSTLPRKDLTRPVEAEHLSRFADVQNCTGETRKGKCEKSETENVEVAAAPQTDKKKIAGAGEAKNPKKACVARQHRSSARNHRGSPGESRDTKRTLMNPRSANYED